MTTLDTPPVDGPAMPYRVDSLPCGLRSFLYKMYPAGDGVIMTPEELAVWEYVRHVEAQRDAARAEADRLRAELEQLRAERAASAGVEKREQR